MKYLNNNIHILYLVYGGVIMVGMPQKKIIRHLYPKDLKKQINKLEKDVGVLRRFYVIQDLYKCKRPENIAEKRGVSLPTVHVWWDRWNEGGYDGLLPKYGNCGCHSNII